MTTTTVTPPALRPLAADPDAWDRPDAWEPGIPIYDPVAHGYGYSRNQSMVAVVPDVWHDDGDCTDTDCGDLRRPFMWRANPDPITRRGMLANFNTRPDGPGTTFYGATIGPTL